MLTNRLTRCAAIGALLVAVSRTEAADATQGRSPLLTHPQLGSRLKSPGLRLLDARPKAAYDKGHIPGAVWVDVKALQALAKPATLADEAAWGKALASLGIGKDVREVFIYDDDRQHDAARVWWTLKYAGASVPVGLVDGGFALWEQSSRPVAAQTEQPAAADFSVRFNKEYLAPRESVIKNAGQLIDARSFEEYTGEIKPKNPNAPVGHIPGARNLDSYSLVDKEGRFLGVDSLRERFTTAGFTTDRPIIVYSAGGNRSAILTYALERIGIPSRHYVGGFGDWTREAKLEVIKGSK